MIPNNLRPMLAAKDASKIQFPVYASPKIDGVRALIVDGRVYSRSLKLIPNAHVQQTFGRPELNGFDGELVVGSACASNCMQATTSGVMRRDGTPDVSFHAFDLWDMPAEPYHTRLLALRRLAEGTGGVRVLEQPTILSQDELDSYEALCLRLGYEGIMVRDPKGKYKFGRSTAKGGELVKVKRFTDDEAVVIGYEERMHNDNAATTDELGHTKRSTHQENLRAAGDLGALVCRTPTGVTFSVGTGFTAEQRQDLWASRQSLIGKLAKYRHFAVTGVLEAPRFPVFVGFRHAEDL
jgi:DNA ligase-1